MEGYHTIKGNQTNQNGMPESHIFYYDGEGNLITIETFFGEINPEYSEELPQHLRKENILFGHSNEKLVSFCSKKSLVEFYNYLYKDSNIFLDRKKNIYDECVSRFRMNTGCTRR